MMITTRPSGTGSGRSLGVDADRLARPCDPIGRIGAGRRSGRARRRPGPRSGDRASRAGCRRRRRRAGRPERAGRPARGWRAGRSARATSPPSANSPACWPRRVQKTWSKPTLRYHRASVHSSIPTREHQDDRDHDRDDAWSRSRASGRSCRRADRRRRAPSAGRRAAIAARTGARPAPAGAWSAAGVHRVRLGGSSVVARSRSAPSVAASSVGGVDRGRRRRRRRSASGSSRRIRACRRREPAATAASA